MAQVATPTFNPDGGEIAPEGTFEIACATSGATIYYTYDPEAAPDPLTWTEYTEAVALPAEPAVAIEVRAYAIKEGSDDSEVKSVTFQTQVEAPEFTPAGGQVNVEDTFALSCNTAGATIRYTYGDTDPNTGWTTYSSAVPLPDTSGQTVAVKAYATKTGIAASDATVVSFYTIGYSSAVNADAVAILDTNATQGLGGVCEGIGLSGSDGDSIDGQRIGAASTTTDLKVETNEVL